MIFLKYKYERSLNVTEKVNNNNNLNAPNLNSPPPFPTRPAGVWNILSSVRSQATRQRCAVEEMSRGVPHRTKNGRYIRISHL
jgi:hypothetical protein